MRGTFTALVGAVVLAMQTGSPAAVGERPWPHLFEMPNGVDCAYSSKTCKRSDWSALLASLNLKELSAPSDGRAYRWLWINQVQSNDIWVPSVGWVEVSLKPDGSGAMRTSWSGKTFAIQAADIAPFEAALKKTDFATLPDQDQSATNWLDYPPEQLMEADIAGQYHFVHRVGGIAEPGIREAGVLLENLARRQLAPTR